MKQVTVLVTVAVDVDEGTEQEMRAVLEAHDVLHPYDHIRVADRELLRKAIKWNMEEGTE